MTKASAQRMTSLAVLSAGFLCSSAAFATVVYDNSSTEVLRTYSPGSGIEFGDEVFLAGTDRTITEFRFETFISANANGNETAQVILRLNNGAQLGPNRIAPGTELARSPVFALGTQIKDAPETHVWAGLSVPVASNHLTWSVVLNGIDSGEQIGLDLPNPPTPTIGSSYDDFWQNNAGTWQTMLIDAGTTPANFAARITAVPEPSTIALGGFGALTLLGYLGLRKRQA